MGTETTHDPEALAEQVVALAREDRRDEKRDDSETELAPGVRADPAPLTYKGVSVEVETTVDNEVELAVIQAMHEADGLRMFSSNTLWDEGYWAAAITDESRTGP